MKLNKYAKILLTMYVLKRKRDTCKGINLHVNVLNQIHSSIWNSWKQVSTQNSCQNSSYIYGCLYGSLGTNWFMLMRNWHVIVQVYSVLFLCPSQQLSNNKGPDMDIKMKLFCPQRSWVQLLFSVVFHMLERVHTTSACLPPIVCVIIKEVEYLKN